MLPAKPTLSWTLGKKLARGLSMFVWASFSTLTAFAQTDYWHYWSQISIPGPLGGTASAQLASDGTNLYYSTLLDGVYKASLADGNFKPIPMTGFPSWAPGTNTNGFAVWHIAVAPHGTLLLSGSPVNVTTNGISAPPSSFSNTLPVFYWWDETNQQWHAAAVTGKSYPYTSSAGNFSLAPDGSVWSCSGFASYAYRSTNDGHSYTAFDVNARVPTNYFPIPPSANLASFGKVFAVAAGPKNEVVIGTETGGYLHTTNNGLNWTSLDPNFTNSQTLNPLGRIGNAVVAGLDHYGNFLCANFELSGSFPGQTNWSGVTLIGYNPKDGSYFNAAAGFAPGFGPPTILTPDSGVSFAYMNQNFLFQGGIYRSPNGKSWTQFNNNIPALTGPWAPEITNALAPGNCFTSVGSQIYAGAGNVFYVFDSTPPPILNRPPTALPQNVNLWRNTATNLTLSGADADGDPLNFTVLTQPTRGILSGTPPHLKYQPNTNTTGTDKIMFMVDDGSATSAPVVVNFSINATNNPAPSITLVSPAGQGWVVGPTNIAFQATASDPNGIQQVNFFNGTNFLKAVVTPPFTFTWTNPPLGEYTLDACVVNHSETSIWAPPASLSVLAAAPKLQIQDLDGINATLTWPTVLDNNFFVETATSPAGPWTLCPYPPSYPKNVQTVTAPMGDAQFFRLMHPH